MRANWCCMRGSSQQGLHQVLDRFSAACEQEGSKISSEKIEVLCLAQGFLDRRPRQYFLQVSGNALQQVEIKSLGVVFTSDESRNKGIDTRIGKANAVLRELYCYAVTKRGLSRNASFSF